MAAARTIEARLVIAGEDRGASQAIANVVKAVRAMEDTARVSKPLQDLTRNLTQVEQASKAVDAAMKARSGAAAAEAGLKATQGAALATAKALDEARRARAAYDGVKAAKGSEQAQQIEAATKAVRAAGEAHRRAEADVRKATAAVAAQTSTLQYAERAASAYGADLKNIESQQVRLRQTYDATTAAVVRLVRAEEQAGRVGSVMGSAGRAQLERIEAGRRLTEGMSAQARATRALADEEARLVRVEHDRKRASAGRDLSTGMGVSGRVEAERIAGGRRVADGMSAPAREARAAVEAARDAAALRSRSQREARDVAAGVVAAGAGSALQGAYVKARDGWNEMDQATRRQRAILGIDEAKQAPLNAQALKIGQDTRFSNPDVVKAQTRIGSSLPAHLKDPKVIAAITENARDYALAMETTMDEGSSAVLGRMLGLRMDMSNPEAAAASAKHATNRLVQFAKSAGADHNDIMGYTKFGAAPSSVGGFSEEFTDAMGAQLRRIGYEGSMAGNFVRAAATKLAVPTSKGLGALAAAGLNHSDYVAPGKALSVDNLDASLKLKFGKKLNDSQRRRIQELMGDESVVGNREEFVPQVSAIVQETLAKKTKKGTVNATDAERIAKSVDQYLTASAGAVDIERLMRDVIAKGITPALAKYLFGQEHGGRAQALDLKTLNKDIQDFRKTPGNRAQKVGEDINAGSYGAYQRMVGSIETFWMRLGQVNDGPLTMFYDKVGNAVDAISNLPNGALQTGTALGGLAGAAIIARGALGAFRIGRDLLGFGGSAAALTKSAALLDAAAIKLAGGSVPSAAAAAAAPAAAFGLGGITVAGGALGGAYLDSSDTTQGGMGTAAITGDETTGQRLIRENREMLERQKTLQGQAEELRQRLETERGVRDRLKTAKEGGSAVDRPLADAEARIKRWEGELGAFEDKIKALAATPMPPVRPDMFKPITDKAAEAGTEAGSKVGDGVRTGIESKAPEVEAQGRSLFQRLKDAFAEGIKIPISFTPGEGMGGGGGAGGNLIHKASFGGDGGDGTGGEGFGGLIRRGGRGGGDRESGGSAGGRASDGPPAGAGSSGRITGPLAKGPTDGIRAEVRAYVRAAALARGIDPNVAERVVNQESGFNPNRNNLTTRERSYGVMQLNTMGGLGAVAMRQGIDPRDPTQWRRHIDFGLDVVKRDGWRQWYGARDVGIGRWQGIGAVKPVPMAKRGRDDGEPRLVKGLDGKEGLDLGNGTMKMPDGSIRSIPPGVPQAGLTIPDPPAGGFGGGRRDLGSAAERMHAAVDRMEGMGFHGQISLAVTGSGRNQVQATGLKVRGRGGMSADMGVSMPGAKEADGDWV